MKSRVRPGNLLFLLSIIIILITTAFFLQKHISEIIHWVHHLGWLAPVLFLIIYCLATLMFLPTMAITLAGGAIFGPLWGTLLNLVGATLGAIAAFLITRHLVADWVSQRQSAKLNKLIHEVEQKGWVAIAILRVFPIIPFNLVNYGLGVTRIKFSTYLLTTFFFLIPPEIVYTYFGYAGIDALLDPGSFYHNGGLVLSGIIVLILCCFKIGLFTKSAKVRTNHPLDQNLNGLPMDDSLQN